MQLFGNEAKMKGFLYTHEEEIDKVKLVMIMLKSYRKNLAEKTCSPEDIKLFKRYSSKAEQLLKGTNETYIDFEKDSESKRIKALICDNTKAASEGKDQIGKTENAERLNEIGDHFLDIVDPIRVTDIERVIAYIHEVGEALAFSIEFNTLLKARNWDEAILTHDIVNLGFETLTSSLNHKDFLEEKAAVLRENIQYIDFDKLLLMSALRTYVKLEKEENTQEQIKEAYRRLKVIEKHIKKNTKISISAENGITLRVRDLNTGMNRFIMKDGEPTDFYKKEQCDRLKIGLKLGVIFLNDATEEEVKAIQLFPEERDWILELFPENYIFYLRKSDMIHPLSRILKNIINAGVCSQDLFQLLCEKTDITSEQICDLYERGIVSLEYLKSIREADLKNERNPVRTIISDESVFEKYQEYKHSTTDEEKRKNARIRLEKYVLAYRNIELAGKTGEEKEEIGLNFIDKQFGDSIEDSDLISLYKFDIIPFEVAIGIGGQDIAKELLKNEGLKKTDIIYLKNQGILTEEFVRDLFCKVCPNMSYSYQLLILYNAFDSNAQQGNEVVERLQQFLHIESASFKAPRQSKINGTIGEDIKNQDDLGISGRPRIEMKGRDPGAKMNLLNATDKDARIEAGIIDGHMIIHLPNVDDGVVVIEKLHDMKTDRKSKITIVTINNESATYIMSEQEFIQMRDDLIQEGKVNRTQLTRKWFDRAIPGNPDPNHWIPHVGAAGWELALIERLEINTKNPRYSKEDIEEIESLMFVSVDSRKQEYTPEHMKKIKELISARLKPRQGEDR